MEALGKRRLRYRLLCLFFCIPALIFLAGAEKRFKAAEAAGDLAEASHAVEAMRTPACVGVAIGVVAIVLRLLTWR